MVCGRANWDVVVKKDVGTNNVLVWPYFMSKGGIKMPPFTAYSGPWWLVDDNQPISKRRQNTMLKSACDVLNDFDAIDCNAHFWFDDGIDVLMEYFRLNTRYTYLMDHTWTIEQADRNFRRNVNHTSEFFTVRESKELAFIKHALSAWMRRKDLQGMYDLGLLKILHEVLRKKDQCVSFYIENEKNETIAGVYLIYDTRVCTCLLSASNDLHEGKTSMYMLLNTAFSFAKKNALIFDFEGSMIRGVGQVFRNMGGRPLPYYACSKQGKLKKIWRDIR